MSNTKKFILITLCLFSLVGIVWAADTKISDLTLKTTPAGVDSLPIYNVADPTKSYRALLGAIPLAGNNELKALGSGLLTNTTTTGALSITNPATFAPVASPTFTGTVTLPVGLTGIPKLTTGVVSVAAAGTDYSAPITAAPALESYSGPTITGINGEGTAMAFGDVVYLAAGTTQTSPVFKWAKADSVATIPAMAMCVSAPATGASGTFLLSGFVSSAGFNVGAQVYLITTGGVNNCLWVSTTGTSTNTMTHTEPVAATNVSQYIGSAIPDAYSAGHTGKSQTMYFNPSPVWVVK
jgi:hypothetical protein